MVRERISYLLGRKRNNIKLRYVRRGYDGVAGYTESV